MPVLHRHLLKYLEVSICFSCLEDKREPVWHRHTNIQRMLLYIQGPEGTTTELYHPPLRLDLELSEKPMFLLSDLKQHMSYCFLTFHHPLETYKQFCWDMFLPSSTIGPPTWKKAYS